MSKRSSDRSHNLEDLPDELLMHVFLFLIGEKFTTHHHSLQPIHYEYYQFSELSSTLQMWRDWTPRNMIDYFDLANLIIPICGVNQHFRERFRKSENFKMFWKRYFSMSLDMMKFMVSAPSRIEIPSIDTYDFAGVGALDLIVGKPFSNLESYFKVKKRSEYFYSIETEMLELFCQLVYDIYGSDIAVEVESLSICYSSLEKLNDMLKIVERRFPNLTSLIVTNMHASSSVKNQNTTIFILSQDVKLEKLKYFLCPSISTDSLPERLTNQLKEVEITELNTIETFENLSFVGVHNFRHLSTYSKNWTKKFDSMIERTHEKICRLGAISANSQAIMYALSKQYFSNLRELYLTFSYSSVTLNSSTLLPYLEILFSDGTVTFDGANLPRLWKIGSYQRSSTINITGRQEKLENLKDLSCTIQPTDLWYAPNLEKIFFTSDSVVTFSKLKHLKSIHTVSCAQLVVDDCPSLEYLDAERSAVSVKVINQRRIDYLVHGKYSSLSTSLDLNCDSCGTLEIHSGQINEFKVNHITRWVMYFSDSMMDSMIGKLSHTVVEELEIIFWLSEDEIKLVINKLLSFIEEFKCIEKLVITRSYHLDPISTSTVFGQPDQGRNTSVSDFLNKSQFKHHDIIDGHYYFTSEIPQSVEVSIRPESLFILSNGPCLERFNCTSMQPISVEWSSFKNLRTLNLKNTSLYSNSFLSTQMEKMSEILSTTNVADENIEILDLSMFPLIERVEITKCPYIRIKASGSLNNLKSLKLVNNARLEIDMIQVNLPHVRNVVIFSNTIIDPSSRFEMVGTNKLIFQLLQSIPHPTSN